MVLGVRCWVFAFVFAFAFAFVFVFAFVFAFAFVSGIRHKRTSNIVNHLITYNLKL